jgi:hypothetical protein
MVKKVLMDKVSGAAGHPLVLVLCTEIAEVLNGKIPPGASCRKDDSVTRLVTSGLGTGERRLLGDA